jgi:hypothetical protein
LNVWNLGTWPQHDIVIALPGSFVVSAATLRGNAEGVAAETQNGEIA